MDTFSMFQDGGVFMIVVLAASGLLWAVVLLMAVLAYVKIRVPSSVFISLAALQVLVGIGGVHFGMFEVDNALAYAPPEMSQTLLIGGTALALLPLIASLMLAAPMLTVGGFAVALGTKTDRWQGAQSTGRQAMVALAIGLVGAVIAGIVWLSIGALSGGDSFTDLAWFHQDLQSTIFPLGLAIVGGIGVVAFAAGRASDHADDGPRMTAATARASLLAIGGVATALAATWMWHFMAALQSTATAPPELMWGRGLEMLWTPNLYAIAGLVALCFVGLAAAVSIGQRAKTLLTARTLIGGILTLIIALSIGLTAGNAVVTATAEARVAVAASAWSDGPSTVPEVRPGLPIEMDRWTAMTRITFDDSHIDVAGGRVERSASTRIADLEQGLRLALVEEAEIAAQTGLEDVQLSGIVWLGVPADVPWPEVSDVVRTFVQATADQPNHSVAIAVNAPDEGRGGRLTWCVSTDGSGWSPPDGASWNDVVQGLIERHEGCLDVR